MQTYKVIILIFSFLATVNISFAGLYDGISGGGVKPYGLYAGERRTINLNNLKDNIKTNVNLKELIPKGAADILSQIDVSKINYNNVVERAQQYAQMPLNQLRLAISNNYYQAVDKNTTEAHQELLASVYGTQIKMERFARNFYTASAKAAGEAPVQFNDNEFEKVKNKIYIVLSIDTSTEASKEMAVNYIKAISAQIDDSYYFVFAGKRKADWYNIEPLFEFQPDKIEIIGANNSWFVPPETLAGAWLYDSEYSTYQAVSPDSIRTGGFRRAMFDLYRSSRDPMMKPSK